VSDKEYLVKLSKSDNIAEELDSELLGKIGNKVTEGFDIDLSSMQEWRAQVEAAENLASLKKEPKNTPFVNSANVKYPLITNACFQFAANTYPEIVQDGKVVKAAVLGRDPTGSKAEQARRVSDYMSYQMLFQTTEWEKGLDKLLNMLPNVGLLFKKTYYDPICKQNCSVVCDPKDIVINAKVECLDKARRVTHILHFCKNDLVEYARAGLFLEDQVDQICEYYHEYSNNSCIDLLEQHRYLDLDEDGYEEPYIVTTEQGTSRVLRIVALFDKDGIETNSKGKISRIKAQSHFTDFHFLPNPNGSFLSIGFGTLMCHLNESINTILNQLIDAGTLRNMQGGYIDSRLKLESGMSRHSPGQWIRIKPVGGQELKQGFMPITYQEPSSVLYQLLGLLIQTGKELSSSTEAMQGSVMPDNAKTGAVSALINQGMKVFNSIRRRIYRSLKDEYMKWFYLDSQYMDEEEYMTVMDDKQAVYRKDFDMKSIDIMPIADPNMSSEVQRLQQIQVLQSMLGQPNVDSTKIQIKTLEFARISDPEQYFVPPNPNQPPPPDVIELQAKMIQQSADNALKARQQDLAEREFQLAAIKAEAEIEKIKSESIKNIALAEAAEKGTQLDDYRTQLDMINSKMSTILQVRQLEQQAQIAAQKAQTPDQEAPNNAEQPQADAGSMAAAPNDQAVPPGPEGAPPGP